MVLMIVQQISVFLERTSHALQSSLEEEAPLARGYVDVLRCLIASSPGGKSDRKTFSQDAMNILKMKSGVRTIVLGTGNFNENVIDALCNQWPGRRTRYTG
jgi:hypothetical protein